MVLAHSVSPKDGATAPLAYGFSTRAPCGSVGDVRGRWPATFDMNVTQYALELAGSTIDSGHREHTTNHAAASIPMDQPTLLVATTSAATSPGLESPLLNVAELSTQARSLLSSSLRRRRLKCRLAARASTMSHARSV